MGIASSFTSSSSTKDKRIKIDEPPNDTIETSLVPNETRNENFEPFTLVCLDDTLDEHDEDLQSILDYMCCFNDLEQCEQFIQKFNKCEHLFFIVSNDYATNIVSHIHDLKQIVAIYILESLVPGDNESAIIIDDKWIKRYSKVKGIYRDREHLVEELSSDVKMYTNICDLFPITIYNRLDMVQTNNTTNDHLRFVFYQLFIHEYCLKSSTSDKNDLTNIIQDYYCSNKHETTKINDFNRKYHGSKNVLQWFLRNSFLRRLLTKSLSTLNLKILFVLRFFVKDMHKSMVDTGLSSDKYQASEQELFYRSQILSSDTLDRIKSNTGELVSINDFFLAAKDRHQALTAIRYSTSSTDKSIHRVLFKIKIPSNYEFHKKRPFIHIEDSSAEEFTTLFFIGSIFQINAAVFDLTNECWTVELTLFDERTHGGFAQVFTYLNEKQSPITLANLLRRISPSAAKHFYKHLLKDTLDSNGKLECYHGLGQCLYACEDYPQALTFFQKALAMESDDELIKSSLHNSIGLVYAQQDNIDKAKLHFSEALKYSSLPLHIACAHYNLALIYGKQQLFNRELSHYQEAFEIRSNQLPSNHIQIATLFNNIGLTYSDMNQYDNALSNLRKALEMRLKLLTETHIDVARSYANIGAVYSKTGEFQMALEYFNKALGLFEKQDSLPDQDIQQVRDNIKIVKEKLK